jgi:hypothetical protein
MKNDIRSSFISVPVPMDLYVGLLDLQRKTSVRYEPGTLVTSILREALRSARGVRRPARAGVSGNANAAPSVSGSANGWSNDWIMFGAPPAPEKAETRVTGHVGDNDWCVGCACPSTDVLSS